MACVNKGFSPEYVAQARGFFERALALDPRNIEALVGTAIADTMSGTGGMAHDRAASHGSRSSFEQGSVDGS